MKRFVIAARSPKTGYLLYYTVAQTLATRGRSKKFTSLEKAWAKARALLRDHPHLRAYNLFAHPADVPISRKNPSAFAKITQAYGASIDEAARKFEDFTGYPATKETIFRQKPIRAGFALGKLVAVTYEQTREGDGLSHYHHEFKKKSRPLLVSSNDGSVLGIVGGQFHVTNRGIEDT